MPEPARIAVLASGGGSNFQSLVDRFNVDARLGSAEVAGVIASRDTAGVLDRARRAGVDSASIPSEADGASQAAFITNALNAWRSDIVVLAGYMKLVPETVVRAYWGRILNIHPALLPAFGGKGMYGANVHRAVIEAGVRVTGATVHFVDEAYDRGPVLCQWPVPVLSGDTAESLAARVLSVEHRLLPAAVEALARDEARLEEGGTVRWKREWFPSDRFGDPTSL